MNSMTTEQLLMCEKADLVKYIEELHNDINAISYEFMSGDDTLEDIHGYIEQKTDEIVELKEQVEELQKDVKKYIKYHNDKSNECEEQRERADYNEKEIMKLKEQVEELKASEQLASHVAKVNAEDIVELQKFIDEFKKDIIRSLKGQNVNENTDHLIDTIGDVVNENESLKKKNEEQFEEWVKVKNACELYKGFMAHHVSEQIEHDMQDRCFGQVDISAGKWLSKFLQKKFYEEIIPVIIDEITDDNVDRGEVSYDNVYSSEVSLDHIGNGCISYTYLEDIQEE